MNNTLNNINKTNSIKYDGQTDEKNGHSHPMKTGKNEYDIKDSKFNVNYQKKNNTLHFPDNPVQLSKSFFIGHQFSQQSECVLIPKT